MNEYFIGLGRIAFDTYSLQRKHIAYDGVPIPKWEALDPGIRDAWIEAAKAVYAQALKIEMVKDLYK